MTRTLGESLDRKPTRREKLVMKLHLFTCDACERYLQHIVFLRDAMHAHGERDPEAAEFSVYALSIESKEKMKAFLRTRVGLAF